MTARLPTPGGDDGDWGDILNAYLSVSLASDGTINPNTVTNTQLDSATQTTLGKANSAIQSVNSKTGTSITLAASDVGAIPTSQLGASNGVATLTGTTLTTSQLPSTVALAGALDARNYIISVSGGITTFNLLQMVTDAVSLNRPLYIPGGKWQPSSYNIALDNNSVDLFTFRICGDGYESEIVLPSAMTSSDSLFIANSSNSNTFVAHPRLYFERFSVTSASSSSATFLTKHQRSLTLNTVYFSNIKNGIYSDGYSDEDLIIRLYAESMTSGGWAYQHAGNGDAVLIQSCFTYACAGFNVTNAKAVQVNGLISGWHSFTESIVDFVNYHIEGDGTTDTDPLILLQGGSYTFGQGVLYGTRYRPAIQVDDSGATGRKTILNLPKSIFRQRIDSPGSTFGSLLGVHLNIVSLNNGSEINFNGTRVEVFGQTPSAAASTYAYLVPNVVSQDSGAGSITNALAARPMLISGETQLRRRNASWALVAYDPNSAIRTMRHTTNAQFIASSTTTATGWGPDGTLAGTTWYYRSGTVDAEGMYTATAPETAGVTPGAGQVVQLDFNTQTAPIRLRIWRTKVSGDYTTVGNVSWVDVFVANETPELFDQGADIAGQAWQTTSIPAIQASNATQDGMVIIGNGHRIIQASAPPTAGPWNQGDWCINNTPSVGAPTMWICTATADPGTWTAGPLVPGLGTQTLSSNGAVTINAATGGYQTITLAANATSSTITNSRVGQVLTIGWIQDGTGSRTYAWPTACLFAAGSAPSASASANYTDQVTFVYDGTHWNEISRAIGIH